MNHTTSDFWDCYHKLPQHVQRLADANYELLRVDSRHPSLHLKRVGRLWSVRVGLGFRALAVKAEDGLVWFWIGSHAEYNLILKQV